MIHRMKGVGPRGRVENSKSPNPPHLNKKWGEEGVLVGVSLGEPRKRLTRSKSSFTKIDKRNTCMYPLETPKIIWAS